MGLSTVCLGTWSAEVLDVHLEELRARQLDLALPLGAARSHVPVVGGEGSDGLVQLLLERGAPVDGNGRTAARTAVQRHVDPRVHHGHAQPPLQLLVLCRKVPGLRSEHSVLHVVERHRGARQAVGDGRGDEEAVEEPEAGAPTVGDDAVEGHRVVEVDEEGLEIRLLHGQQLFLQPLLSQLSSHCPEEQPLPGLAHAGIVHIPGGSVHKGVQELQHGLPKQLREPCSPHIRQRRRRPRASGRRGEVQRHVLALVLRGLPCHRVAQEAAQRGLRSWLVMQPPQLLHSRGQGLLRLSEASSPQHLRGRRREGRPVVRPARQGRQESALGIEALEIVKASQAAPAHEDLRHRPRPRQLLGLLPPLGLRGDVRHGEVHAPGAQQGLRAGAVRAARSAVDDHVILGGHGGTLSLTGAT
mmetsp:Transcript_33086/g.95130  ORF Transcript_33086/g.95130 Transcript_33086/m.95130 type:complete len:414 (+) Transcript_33086:734-1975(+)